MDKVKEVHSKLTSLVARWNLLQEDINKAKLRDAILERAETNRKEMLADFLNLEERLQIAETTISEQKQLDLAKKYATLPDYEKVEYQLEGSVIIVVFRKTVQFIDALQKLDCKDEAKAITFYQRLFLSSFESQLRQLPHLAALFYNDALFLHLRSGFLKEIEERGADLLNSCWATQSAEIDAILSNGLIDDEREYKPFMQARLKLVQLGRNWQGILDNEIYGRLLMPLLEKLFDWTWQGILHIEEGQLSKNGLLSILDSIEALLEEPCFRSLQASTLQPFLEKFPLARRFLSMSLIQATTAYRRDEFAGIVSLEELHDLIIIFYNDSPSRKSLLTEIFSEINA